MRGYKIISLILAITLLFIIILVGLTDCKNNSNYELFKNIITCYDHHNNIVYSKNQTLFYKGNKIEVTIGKYVNKMANSKIEYIDNNKIIFSTTYTNTTDYYMLEDKNVISNIYSSNEKIYDMLYSNGKLYFKLNDGRYSSYDINNNILNEILKDDYYKIRDGLEYNVVEHKNDNKVVSLVVNNLNSGDSILINKDFLEKNNLIMELKKYYDYDIVDYSVFNNNIFIHVKFDVYYVTFLYKNGLKIYDYFESDYEDIKCFYVDDINQPLYSYLYNYL